MAVGSFFSAAPTAQNSPELHFRFINSFIQPSLVGSLPAALFYFAGRLVLWQYLPGTSSSSYLLPFRVLRGMNIKKVEKLLEFPKKSSNADEECLT